MSLHAWAIILVSFAVTYALRGIPFWMAKKWKGSALLEYLAVTMPAGIMLILVIYSLQSVAQASVLATALGVVVTAAFHLWRGQALISITAGVLTYGAALALLA